MPETLPNEGTANKPVNFSLNSKPQVGFRPRVIQNRRLGLGSGKGGTGGASSFKPPARAGAPAKSPQASSAAPGKWSAVATAGQKPPAADDAPVRIKPWDKPGSSKRKEPLEPRGEPRGAKAKKLYPTGTVAGCDRKDPIAHLLGTRKQLGAPPGKLKSRGQRQLEASIAKTALSAAGGRFRSTPPSGFKPSLQSANSYTPAANKTSAAGYTLQDKFARGSDVPAPHAGVDRGALPFRSQGSFTPKAHPQPSPGPQRGAYGGFAWEHSAGAGDSARAAARAASIFQAPESTSPLFAALSANTSSAKSTANSSSAMASNAKRTALSKVLDTDEHASDEAIAALDIQESEHVVIDSLTADAEAGAARVDGACVECEERAATATCRECDDLYCDMCFALMHRKGKRALHTKAPRLQADVAAAASRLHELRPGGPAVTPGAGAGAGAATAGTALGVGSEYARYSPEWFVERAKYVPVRITLKERKNMRLIAAALSVSDYTGVVDSAKLQKGAKRTHRQVKEICSLFTGLILGTNYGEGQKVIGARNFDEDPYNTFLRTILEFIRRHKIINPERLRTNYAKLVYQLQDSVSPEVKRLLDFSCVAPIDSVFNRLKGSNAHAALCDPAMKFATMEILPESKPRHQIQQEIKQKERAQEQIARKYANPKISRDDIKWCLYSIGDNSSFLTSNRLPIDVMIGYLKEEFSPDRYEEGYSLAIIGGEDGARLTHSHGRQYHYVLQSLTLWREIADDMFRLTALAEDDLLDEANRYVLKDTGQGLQRVQAAPRILSAMRTILHRCQVGLGDWIGSSVIHLGDTNVPNALLFLDKYTQVARILSPITQAIREIGKLEKKEPTKRWMHKTYGGAKRLKKMILYDFFKNAFDGSGADNFFDAGSCIDGRLTSAWHWCTSLPEKPFFPVFRLAGFTGFDGDFQE